MHVCVYISICISKHRNIGRAVSGLSDFKVSGISGFRMCPGFYTPRVDSVFQSTVANTAVRFENNTQVGMTETEAIGRCGTYENFQRGLANGDITKRDGFCFFRRRTEGTEARSSRDQVMGFSGETTICEVAMVN